jgi:hypothetical protein
MRRVFGGAVLVSAGVAAFIEAHTYKPHRPEIEPLSAEPLSRTAYDLLRIGGWVLVIFGSLIIITGLIRYWVAQTQELEEKLEERKKTRAREARDRRDSPSKPNRLPSPSSEPRTR